MIIRPAKPTDLAAITRNNLAMALETEDKHLTDETVLAGVRAILEDPAKGLYWVAESSAGIIGQVMVTTEWSDWRSGYFWWIQSVYVLPEFRGKKIFRKLYDHVVQQAKSSPGVCGIRLYVDEGNRSAQRVYQALGMVRTDYQLFEVDWSL